MQERKNTHNGETSIDLGRLVKALWKKKWFLVSVTVIFGLVAYIYSAAFITPTYRTSFTAYVNNRVATEGSASTTTSDLNASIGLTYLYGEIITSRSVLTDAAQQCGINADYEELSKMVSVSIADSAALIEVYVVSTDPVQATRFAAAIAETAPEHVARVVEGSSMRIVDSPVEPTGKYAPSNSKNAILGAVIGFVAVAACIIIMELVNDKVLGSEDLESRYQIPVIGSIPDLEQAEKTRGRYGYYKQGGKG